MGQTSRVPAVDVDVVLFPDEPSSCVTANSSGQYAMRIDRLERRVQRRLARLPLGARQELLRVLATPSDVRADLIRQMHEQADTRDLAEVLMDLEAEPQMRLSVMQALKESVKG